MGQSFQIRSHGDVGVGQKRTSNAVEASLWERRKCASVPHRGPRDAGLIVPDVVRRAGVHHPGHKLTDRPSVNRPLTISAQIVNQLRLIQNRRGAVSSLVCQRPSLTFRARSYMAFVFAPQPPIGDWLAGLDVTLDRSKGFFAGHPVALDLTAAALNAAEIAQLVADLQQRNIRVLGIEGIDAAEDIGLPPILRGGRIAQEAAPPEPAATADPAPAKREPASLLIDKPVRSGQSVAFIEGDITVLGSVASGAEIIAGGSIHIYGALRGQAMAGATGNSRARIFCHRFEAELLAIGSYYRTADEIEESLRRGPAQAWLDGNMLKISAMN